MQMRLPQAVFFNKPDFLLSEIICINQIYIMRGKNNLIIRFLESLFSRLVITKKLLNLDKEIYEFML